ncbi:alpha/beta fold hydrolase [Ornithinimicrobium sp. LYQ121]
MPAQATVALQADTHAALLDAQGIDRAAVLAGSAGTTSALALAVRHPDRVAGLACSPPTRPASSTTPTPSQAGRRGACGPRIR